MLANGAFVRLVVAGIYCSYKIYIKFKRSSNLQLYVAEHCGVFFDSTGYRTLVWSIKKTWEGIVSFILCAGTDSYLALLNDIK